MPRNFQAISRDEMWTRVYSTARDVYTTIDGYEDYDARLTADAAVAGWYRRVGLFTHERRRLGGLSRMPPTGNLLNLGDFTELEWVTPSGQIRGIKFAIGDHVPLMWSHRRQALFILPSMSQGPCNLPPQRTENALAQMWAKGRPAPCSAKFTHTPKPLPVVYPAIEISYYSDKFTHGKPMDYIHHFGPGVLCYFSHEPYGSRRAPDVMIRGGRLRLASHGIDG
jgi:hypothetical protein